MRQLEQIVLPPHLQVGVVSGDDSDAMAKWRRRAIDVQHLAGHWMSKNDAFATNDRTNMLDKSARLRSLGSASLATRASGDAGRRRHCADGGERDGN